MARKKSGQPSISGYFREQFHKRPEWLRRGSNDKVKQQWLADHAGQEWTKSVASAMANVKSQLKRKKKKGGPAARGEEAARVKPLRGNSRADNLDHLEESIDDCLMMARRLDPDHLDKVIKHLRAARNAVVLMNG